MRTKSHHKNSRRNSEVQRAMAAIIQSELKDPRISPLTSVTAVEVAADLQTCKVWISVFGDEREKSDTLAGLTVAKGFIRSRLAQTVNLRNTPEVRFILDESMEYGARMEQLIADNINQVTK